MATFLIKSIDGDLPMYSCNYRNQAIRQADFFRLCDTPCYILKKFSKAGHDHIARIDYNRERKCWEEQESKSNKYLFEPFPIESNLSKK